ncbi:ribosomal protein L11 methyltransferase [Gemmata sp. SH-PL17]|uniref:TIGR03000 domain-containing protein n=1 Tax=Gemmata sp. SH-PL17 TaxID=1630693 RepID=UPI0004B2FA32|nr:TIGR03000 domain-containing protein [Gemmata sp. SH-PL17]AMV25730.1 ribosomal protein L11 methyltransferase [Gemmata sp. SH-PL17]
MRTVRVGAVGFVVATLIGVACAQEKKPATITITVPDRGYKETVVKVDGDEVIGTGVTRTFTTPALEAGKEYTFKIEALIEPNNYTKITRPREIKVKAGDAAKIDLTTEDKKLDKIVVRWVPTPVDIVDEMAKLAKIGKNDVIFDPGCGDAVMLIRPVKELGAKKGIGIDIDPKMVAEAKTKAKAEGVADRVVITEGDILNEKDMAGAAEATVVLVYIGDDLGARMSPVLQKLLKPGARVVSHRFKLGDWKPDRTVTVKGADGEDYVLHLWTVKEKEKK